ncbi:MAG: ABC transporter permease [Peptococcaceae bacterium]|nr:ABC transporter permease [Peptococcaceae bacterium]
MIKYIIGRILQLIPVVLAVSFIIFTIMSFTPGDAAMIILGEEATPEALEELREEMGLNDPFLVQYFNYLKNALQGDFGTSYRTKEPVFSETFARFPTTLKIVGIGILLSVVISIPIGVMAAVKQYSVFDNITLFVSLVTNCLPNFWIGMLLMLVFSLALGWLPATGIDTWKHYLMPLAALSIGSISSYIRLTRSTMLETIRQDYIRTARAKGAPEKTVIFKHALRNSLLPIITVAGTNFGFLIGGTIMIEAVFAIPGMGSLLINSVRGKDTPMVMANVLFVAVMAGVINLIVDLIYTLVDPRVKSRFAGK